MRRIRLRMGRTPNLLSVIFACAPREMFRRRVKRNTERETRRWIYIHAYISSFRMTYSCDYPDVDPSVHPGPITRMYRSFSSFLSFSFSFYRRTHRSSLRPRFFIGVPLLKKKSSLGLKSHFAVWECKTRLFTACINSRCYNRDTFRRG